jgi:anti-sigma factor RsiW
MSGKTVEKHDCGTFVEQMQDYLDKTLPRKESMSLFLHVRECDGCRQELESLQDLFAALSDMPEVSAPEEFDARVLASVPYESYREMAELRSERLPVILEEEILPAIIRSGVARAAGVTMAALVGVGMVSGWLPAKSTTLLVLGLMPETLVRLQQVSRRLYAGSIQKSTSR